MTTSRVTVPVEPEFTRYRRSQIAHLRPYVAGEALSDRVSISAADLEAGSPKQGDMIARNPANHDDQWLVAADYFAANFEPVSAAPAPEGGAVLEDALDAWIVEGMKKADQCIAEITPVGCSGMTPEDVETGRVSAYKTGFQNGVKSTLTDAAFVIMNAALATREEAPAEAGEPMTEAEVREWIDACNHEPGRQVLRDYLALRAQPPARDDARPVAWRMVGRDGSTISLQAEPYHGGFAHMMAADVGCTVEPLYTHPAPDALRAAVEALWPRIVAMEDFLNEPQRRDVNEPIEVCDYRHDAYRVWTPLCQALATLQAEQGAK